MSLLYFLSDAFLQIDNNAGDTSLGWIAIIIAGISAIGVTQVLFY